MNDHLTPEQLAALAGSELPDSDLDSARAHLSRCLTCSNLALDNWLLKSAIGKSGHRYEVPAEFRNRMASLVARESAKQDKQGSSTGGSASSRHTAWTGMARWTTAALVLLALAGWALLAYRTRGVDAVRAPEIAEACDLHIAALAATESPQVVSSDRHTVKPWFQGKLPFSFNIPETLPAGATLDGANLAYSDGHPVAQLLFHIDRHRVSVFVQDKNSATARGQFALSRAGFQVIGVDSEDLELIAVSDVEAGRLQALVKNILAVQAHP